MLMKRLLGAATGLALSLAAALPAHAEDVVVFAAASLTNALNEIGESFTSRTGHRMIPSYAASSALAKQVEQGGPGQVFASADLQWMDYLAGKKLINPDSRFNLLGNTLVLVAPVDSKQARIELTPKTDIAALAGSGRIATGNPDSVPVGLYFKQAMERAGQWKALETKIAATDSVRAALAFVERGEVPLGVVYATDAAVSKKVKVVGVFPDTMHDPIIYPFALIAGRESPAAKALLDTIKGPEAKAVFVKYGFKIN
ncbi:molybdate ABC transporter substrate-binding protein [Paramagnetospirillum magneticum]|uniref:ABC-type molybdate transport system, periplasmic component n=1 Tax=Paramagnetospirillum magneticum (strain ATCC 700264 / AMB-1) TaxID=342108 RepID=Q2W320_PARM1|nr:molybdate ABC transporter substrate-binding protein [Paramagnetospirillum magneticum]BAE51755.1 ABC-type molybdate transport system, periplasmic component [Paramagnetospirillum magneticum AMB-1]